MITGGRGEKIKNYNSHSSEDIKISCKTFFMKSLNNIRSILL